MLLTSIVISALLLLAIGEANLKCINGNEKSIRQSESLQIECPKNDVVIIDFGSYGSHDKVNPKSFDLVREMCEFKNNCIIKASSEHFGDPCPGVNKFLTVKWRCIPVSRITYGTEYVCNNQIMTLECKNDNVLLISYANFGSVGPNKCTNFKELPESIYPKSTEIVRGMCSRAKKCFIHADSKLFPTESKNMDNYLLVNWRCVPAMPCYTNYQP